MYFRILERAQMIILLKPGKAIEQATSYRPISLLPSISKFFEKLILNDLKLPIENRHFISDNQFGFWNNHSIIS